MARNPARRRYDKRLVYEPLNCDRDALNQETHLARIAGSGAQPSTHLSEKIQRARSYCPPEFRARLVQKESSGGDKNTWSPSERRQVLRRQQQNDLSKHCDVPCHGLAPCQGTRVRPSGRLPSSLVRLIDSLEAGMPAEEND